MIYFVAQNIGMFGGAAVVAMDVVDSMLRSDTEFQAICHGYKIPDERAEALESLKRLKMPFVPDPDNYTGARFGSIRYLLKNLQGSYDLMRLKQQIKKNPPELMIYNGYRASIRAIFDQYEDRCRSVQLVHVSPKFVEDFEDFITLDDLRTHFSRSDALVFVSDECRKKWLELDGIEEEKSYYIPNCAKEDAAKKYLATTKAETREKLGLDRDTFCLVSVASVQPRKGQDLLIEAAPALKKIAPNLKILIIGGRSGEFYNDLQHKAHRNNLNFIQFMGRKPNAMEYIYASDAFILTSRAEAFPLVILESMILKTPVMGSNVDGVPEMVVHDKTGLLFESENVQDLIRQFEKIYNHPNDRNRYAEQASNKYWEYFSKEHFTKRYAGLIKKYSN